MSVRRVVALVGAAALVAAALVASRHAGASRVAASLGASPPSSGAPLPVLDTAPAPDVAALADGWLNTDPLEPSALVGRVVLYDVWTFRCINCLNTLPHLRAWHDRYAADGLVIVGVHSPEFADEAVPANVAAAVRDLRIAYPVALDPDHRVWRAFDNHYWPAFFLYDRTGQRRHQHVGEGAYDTMEDAIRALLGVDASSPRAVVGPE